MPRDSNYLLNDVMESSLEFIYQPGYDRTSMSILSHGSWKVYSPRSQPYLVEFWVVSD